ncbi:MAG: U32 family peptidase [Clostridiales bacterium]|nr:U32 family peptidase [Clostridiales bacterium]
MTSDIRPMNEGSAVSAGIPGKKTKPELLLPAGSPDSLLAALDGGADAVYLGGRLFNARMNARNFGDEELARGLTLCRGYGAKLYVTLNTLISDRELDEAVRYAGRLYEIGVDALIVGDLGLAAALREYLPELPLHGSTQLSAHNIPGVNALGKMGFERVVAARELSKGDLARLKAGCGDIGIEIFIHGAHCVSASGMCLFSAMAGGRSGNRGMCAQPCRLPYEGGYRLSLKDMCLAGHIREIIELGVDSLKVEGRMKPPSYVYTAASVYRRLLDEGRDADNSEMKRLEAAFSRSGFTDGYFTGRINPSMLGVRTDSDKAKSDRIDYRPSERAVKESEFAQTAEITKRNSANLPEKKITYKKYTPKRKSETTAEFMRSAQIPADFKGLAFLPAAEYLRSGANAAGIILPPVAKDSELAALRESVEKAAAKGADSVMAQNIGQLSMAASVSGVKRIYIGLRMNTYGSGTAKVFESIVHAVNPGMEVTAIASPELILPQLRDLCADFSAVVYGRLPLMVLELPTGENKLTDRTKAVFPVMRPNAGTPSDREEIYNSAPVWMADKTALLDKFGVTRRHFIFTDESREQAGRILSAYSSGNPKLTSPPKNFRRIREKHEKL